MEAAAARLPATTTGSPARRQVSAHPVTTRRRVVHGAAVTVVATKAFGTGLFIRGEMLFWCGMPGRPAPAAVSCQPWSSMTVIGPDVVEALFRGFRPYAEHLPSCGGMASTEGSSLNESVGRRLIENGGPFAAAWQPTCRSPADRWSHPRRYAPWSPSPHRSSSPGSTCRSA